MSLYHFNPTDQCLCVWIPVCAGKLHMWYTRDMLAFSLIFEYPIWRSSVLGAVPVMCATLYEFHLRSGRMVVPRYLYAAVDDHEVWSQTPTGFCRLVCLSLHMLIHWTAPAIVFPTDWCRLCRSLVFSNHPVTWSRQLTTFICELSWVIQLKSST